MRTVAYGGAMSLDGFIAGPNGEYDWIVMDPSIDFNALYKEFDTVVMGRKTYEMAAAQGGHGAMPGLEVVAFSQTLPPATYPGVRVSNEDPRHVVAELKKKTGRDIWLFGGGTLLRSLLDAGLVDTVEVAVMPVILGSGIPLVQPGSSTKLVLSDQKTLPATGIVVLSYAVAGANASTSPIAYVKHPKKKRVTAGKKSKVAERKRPNTKRRAR